MTQPRFQVAKKLRVFGLSIATLAITMGFAHTALADEAYDYNNITYENNYIEEAPKSQYVFVTAYNLRLRQGPSTDHEIIVTLPSGTQVTPTYFNPENEFTPVIAGNLSGYVATRYIRMVDITPQTAAITPTHAAPNGTIELLSWSYVRTIMPTGTNIQVYDVWSGLTYTVRNFSNGNHADVETISRNDTEIMRASSGGFSWDARPVIVTFNGRSVAAAINTMPHAGSTIMDNGKNGHICLHFYGSRPHNGNRAYEQQMQTAVRQAFNHR